MWMPFFMLFIIYSWHVQQPYKDVFAMEGIVMEIMLQGIWPEKNA